MNPEQAPGPDPNLAYRTPFELEIMKALESPDSLAGQRAQELVQAYNNRQDGELLEFETAQRCKMSLTEGEAFEVVERVLDEKIRLAKMLFEASLRQPAEQSEITNLNQ
jgi:hypothetical protein